MYALLLFAMAVPSAPTPDPEHQTPKGTSPVQCVASIDGKGKLTIARMMPTCSGVSEVELRAQLKREGKEPLTVLVTPKVTRFELVIVELQAEDVLAFSTYGKPITAKDLAERLAKERTVLVAVDGKKVDASMLQFYKEDTIVLVPPAGLWADSAAVAPEPDIKEKKDEPLPK